MDRAVGLDDQRVPATRTDRTRAGGHEDGRGRVGGGAITELTGVVAAPRVRVAGGGEGHRVVVAGRDRDDAGQVRLNRNRAMGRRVVADGAVRVVAPEVEVARTGQRHAVGRARGDRHDVAERRDLNGRSPHRGRAVTELAIEIGAHAPPVPSNFRTIVCESPPSTVWASAIAGTASGTNDAMTARRSHSDRTDEHEARSVGHTCTLSIEPRSRQPMTTNHTDNEGTR